MNALKLKRRTLLAGGILTAFFMTAVLTAFAEIDRRTIRDLYGRSMQTMGLLDALSPATIRGASIPRVFPWQRVVLVDGGGTVVADTGWLENDTLTNDASGSIFAAFYRRASGLQTAPSIRDDELKRTIETLPATRHLGLADNRTIIGSRSTWDGRGRRIVLIVDRRDLVAARRMDRISFAALCALILILFAIFVMFLYVRLILPTHRLADAVRRLDPTSRSPDISLPGEGRGDEVGYLATALVEAVRASRNARRTLNEFIEDVLHELKNPITSLRTRLDLALLRSPSSEGDGVHLTANDLIQLTHDVGRTARLLSSLNTLSAADTVEVAGTCNLAELLDRLANAYATTDGPKVITDGVCKAVLPVDPDVLGRILRIIVDNALDFTDPHRGVALRCRVERAYCTIEIDDYGPGIPEGRREWVFQRFASTRKERSDGHVGLGLSIARSLVRNIAHRGDASTLTADANPWGGARFVLRIPTVDE